MTTRKYKTDDELFVEELNYWLEQRSCMEDCTTWDRFLNSYFNAELTTLSNLAKIGIFTTLLPKYKNRKCAVYIDNINSRTINVAR